MDDRQVAQALVKLAKSLVSEADKGTFKCPECDTKVLKQTSYCVKCQKKVKQAGNRTAVKTYGSVREMVADVDAMGITVSQWMEEYEDEGDTGMQFYKDAKALFAYLSDVENELRKYKKKID